MLSKYKMAATDQLHNFVGAKTIKSYSQKLFEFYYHIPHDMEMCIWLFKVSLKLKIAATNRLLKLINYFKAGDAIVGLQASCSHLFSVVWFIYIA